MKTTTWKRERERVVVIISKPGGEDGTMQHTRQTRMEWTYVFDDQLSFIRNRRDGVGSTLSCVRKKKGGGGRDIFFILVGYVATSQDVCPFAFPRVKKKKRKGKRERERYGMSIVGGPFLRRWILSHSHWRIESRNNISTLLLLDCFLFATFLTFPKRGRVAIIG